MANSSKPRRNKRRRLTVYIGRFQPLHLGHAHILGQAIDSSDAVLVLVGSAFIARNIKNPFTYQERHGMLEAWAKNYLRDAGVSLHKLPIIRPIRDQPYNHAKWFQTVQEEVENAIQERGWDRADVDVALTGSDRDDSTWYLKSFPQYTSDLKEPVPPGQDLSATKLRHRLFNATALELPNKWPDVPSTTFDFIGNFIGTKEYSILREEYEFNIKYKTPHAPLLDAIKQFVPSRYHEKIEDIFTTWLKKQYAPTFVTADACIIQSGHVLVVRRGALPGKGLIALPGGFVKGDQTLLEAAIDEVIEETGLRLADGKNALKLTRTILRGYLKGSLNFDEPGRSLRGRTFTTCHLFRLDDTKPLPVVKGQFMPLEDTGGVGGIVETADAFWMPISVARANPEWWFEDHHAILDTMLGLIKD